MKSTPIDHTCPTCGKQLDMATGVTDPGTAPEPGDISVCIYCGSLGVYIPGNPIKIRKATQEEHDVLILDQNIRKILAVRARTVGDP